MPRCPTCAREAAGNRNRRNDADDRHDDQQLDEGEALVSSAFLHVLKSPWVAPERKSYDRLIGKQGATLYRADRKANLRCFSNFQARGPVAAHARCQKLSMWACQQLTLLTTSVTLCRTQKTRREGALASTLLVVDE